MNRKKRIKRPVTFKRGLFYVLAALSSIGILLTVVLGVYLYTYEHNHPKYLVDSIVDEYKAKELDSILGKSDKSQRKDLKNALPKLLKKDKLFAYQSFEDKEKLEYIVVNNNQKLSTIVIEKTKDKALFGIQKVRVKKIEHYPTYSYRVHYFANTTVSVNGEDVTQKGKETSTSTQFASIGYDEIKTFTYTHEGFSPIENMSATYQGKPCAKVIDNTGFEVSFYPNVSENVDLNIKTMLTQYSKEYARYTTLRGIGSGAVLQYVMPNSNVARMITSYSNTWGEVSVAENFSEIQVGNPICYYDHVYSYDVHLTYYITADNGDQKEFPMDYRMYVVNTGYTYQVFDMERISKEEQKREESSIASRISPSFSIGDTTLDTVCVDDNLSTAYTFKENDRLRIQSEQEIGYLYIKWGSRVNEYTMHANKKITKLGDDGFLHELIKVDKNTKEIELHKLTGNVMKEISVYSTGELPKDVQDWKAPYKKSDILAFPTHADDDTLYLGSLISEYAAKGKKIQLAFLTNSNSASNTVDVDVRKHEMLDGMWEMGLRAYPIVGEFEDIASRSLQHAKSVYDTNALQQFQVANIRRFQPDIVIGHDENGEYGHGVHMLNTFLLKDSIHLSNDATYDVDSYKKFGLHSPKKTYFHLYTKNQIALDVHQKMDALHGRTPFEVASAAYGKHKSQHQYALAVEDYGVGDCRLFGLYESSVGYDSSTNNIFMGIE